jgi:phosphoribosylformylglycinamidine synthase
MVKIFYIWQKSYYNYILGGWNDKRLKGGTMVKRIFVEKRSGYNVEAQELLSDLKENLLINSLKQIRIINRYDIDGISEEVFQTAKPVIFSEPMVDEVYEDLFDLPNNSKAFAVEYLPGQYDQRADSAAQCVQIITQGQRPKILTAKIIILEGNIVDSDYERIKEYYINPVEAREASFETFEHLDIQVEVPKDVEMVNGFITMQPEELKTYMDNMGFAMEMADILFCQDYFKHKENRNPSVTEMRMIDTYWSDHCRHTTFSTELTSVQIEEGWLSDEIDQTYQQYCNDREEVYGERISEKQVCLMDLATMAVKKLKKDGLLQKLDESEEINACSIEMTVDVEGEDQEWLVMFKNETHNHPTEIEPFGGAATCLGGAIRDPLSGRSYVYQAMRVTGAGNPTKKISETLPGKLPQRKLTRGAALGYSSYGNQIGLATGQVREIYDEGYVAKRMEIGAVIAAAPKENIVRVRPETGDKIVLLGGKTGRDGCGGATGSSKAHSEDSILTCGAEVQKGNPPEERKIQRLFRQANVTQMIKRCNDFGAGGVSVAIGELADGLEINLDAVPKKYEGLDGTELAISESQERMAVVVNAADVDAFISAAHEENLQAVEVAIVTESPRLKMFWRGKQIVDISREFLNTNGATRSAAAFVEMPNPKATVLYNESTNSEADEQDWIKTLSNINVCSQKGLAEQFDSSIGAGTVLMPFGGKNQLTPEDGMIAKIPVKGKETTSGTIMTYGYNPYVFKWSPYHGAMFAVIESISKIVALGGDYKETWLTFQEYFKRLGTDEKRWGEPVAALLGAYKAQREMQIAAIGGKDSMSGSFNERDVPPTLVSFAVAPTNVAKTVSAAFKHAGASIGLFVVPVNDKNIPDFIALKQNYDVLQEAIKQEKIVSAKTVGLGGIAATLAEMAFGNDIGIVIDDTMKQQIFAQMPGSVIVELAQGECIKDYQWLQTVGRLTTESYIHIGESDMSLDALKAAWRKPLEKVFPTQKEIESASEIETISWDNGKNIIIAKNKIAKPKVFIPVFPGTNCEYDSAKAFEMAGAIADVFVFNNQTPHDIETSLRTMERKIDAAQMVMIPGGFSGGDEPEGSGKFIATAFRNPLVGDAVMRLLNQRDGLMLGICNGFQALIKLGLVPYGEIRDLTKNDPTLTYNTIGRHLSCMVTTRIASNKSPWLQDCNVGDTHVIPISHGEGRFVASDETIKQLISNGQIATQYVNQSGEATMCSAENPNGSVFAIEGITSPDGRILGKMGHSERKGNNIANNVPGSKDQKIFEAGVAYFK